MSQGIEGQKGRPAGFLFFQIRNGLFRRPFIFGHDVTGRSPQGNIDGDGKFSRDPAQFTDGAAKMTAPGLLCRKDDLNGPAQAFVFLFHAP